MRRRIRREFEIMKPMVFMRKTLSDFLLFVGHTIGGTGKFLSTGNFGRQVFSDWDIETAIDEGIKSNPTVYSCITRIARTIGSIEWRAEIPGPSGPVEIPNHPVPTLINNPNADETRALVFERLMQHLYSAGNGLLFRNRVDGGARTVELTTIHPAFIDPVPGRDGFLSHYEYAKDGRTLILPKDDIIHFQFADPNNPFWGMAPIQAGSRLIDTNNQALIFNKSNLENRTSGDLAFVAKNQLSDKQYADMRKHIADTAGAKNSGKPYVLDSDTDIKILGRSPAELEFANTNEQLENRICSIMGVPPTLIGDFKNATLANLHASRYIYYIETIVPLLSFLAAEFTRVFKDELNGAVLKFNTENIDVLNLDRKSKVESGFKLFNMGVPFNEISQSLDIGIDEIEGGNQGWVSSALMPVGPLDPAGIDEIDIDEPDEDEETRTAEKPKLKPILNPDGSLVN